MAGNTGGYLFENGPFLGGNSLAWRPFLAGVAVGGSFVALISFYSRTSCVEMTQMVVFLREISTALNSIQNSLSTSTKSSLTEAHVKAKSTAGTTSRETVQNTARYVDRVLDVEASSEDEGEDEDDFQEALESLVIEERNQDIPLDEISFSPQQQSDLHDSSLERNREQTIMEVALLLDCPLHIQTSPIK